MKKWLMVIVLTLMAQTTSASDLLLRSNQYDFEFKKYQKMYLPAYDWRLIKAQCWQESRFRLDALSPVGARSICQFMPGTFKDVQDQLGLPMANPWDPKLNIMFASFYMSRLNSFWKFERPHTDRVSLALASYNAGAGHLVKAQKLCGGSVYYGDIVRCLPKVTGHHSKETIGYVTNIWGFFILLLVN